RIDQAACRGDHKHAGRAARRPRKCCRIGNLPAEVEAAQKSEHVRDWCATFAAQSLGKRELRPIAQNHSRSFAAGISGGEKKNPVMKGLFHLWRFSTLLTVAATWSVLACFLSREFKVLRRAFSLAI